MTYMRAFLRSERATMFLFAVAACCFVVWPVLAGDPNPDADGDGYYDEVDNCPYDYNPDQDDTDGDGQGDVCDTCINDFYNDSDGDSYCANDDNCPENYNPDQADYDYDGLGDACDSCLFDYYNDEDFDGFCADQDNCPHIYNPDQYDADADGVGDTCDLCANDPDNDIDGDSYCGNIDNCPGTYNPGQEDQDLDNFGNACDDDIDGDDLPNTWETAYGMNPFDNGIVAETNGPAGDQDGDTHNNAQEYVADTNPNASSSVFRVRGIAINSPVTIVWSSRADRTYSVVYTTNLLSGNWFSLTSGIPGSNALTAVVDTNNAVSRSYQLKVSLP